MPLDIIIGAQWGDEGKGRMVDLLAAETDWVARYNGGDNAGHTVTVGAQTFKLHLIPSGIIHLHTQAVIGNGVVINLATLLAEIETLQAAGVPVSPARLHLSHAAHLITPAHRALDAAMEARRGGGKLGTTLRGIGPAYIDKVARSGLRAGLIRNLDHYAAALRFHTEAINRQLEHIYAAPPLVVDQVVAECLQDAERAAPFVADVSTLLSQAISHGQRVLAEGAQGTLLDLDHGTYPFVTSSTPTAAGALVGLGLGVGCVERVIGVTKAFQTRVGSGPFPTELSGELAGRLRGTGQNPWDEFGTTTGRPRRVGWLDLVLLRYAVQVNGLTELALTKLDILSGLEPLKICNAYRRGGEVFTRLPFGPGELEGFEPIYEELPGWKEDLRGARTWEELPSEARAYLLRVEELAKVPVGMASVGPEREQIVEITGID